MISPPPSSIFCSSRDHYIDHTYLASVLNVHFQGMTTMIIAPLTTIKQQIEDDCWLYGLDLGVGDLFWKFIFSLNRAWKWFNSKFNSKQNPKYSFKKYSFNWVREFNVIIYSKDFEENHSRLKKKGPKNYSPRIWQKIVGMIRNNCSSWGSWSFPRNR